MEPELKNRTHWGRWDIESGFCPYGHPLIDCRVIRKRPDGREFNVCGIKDRMRKRVKRNAPKKSKVNSDRPVRLPINKEDAAGNGSTEHSGNFKVAWIEFVCGHNTEYLRRTIMANAYMYPGMLYCHRCQDFKHIHSVSHSFEGFGAWIYRPLEVKES